MTPSPSETPSPLAAFAAGTEIVPNCGEAHRAAARGGRRVRVKHAVLSSRTVAIVLGRIVMVPIADRSTHTCLKVIACDSAP